MPGTFPIHFILRYSDDREKKLGYIWYAEHFQMLNLEPMCADLEVGFCYRLPHTRRR